MNRVPEATEQQCPASGRNHAAPVRLRPIARCSQRHGRQQRDRDGPSHRGPRLQHPAQTRGKQTATEPHAPDGMSEDAVPDRQHEGLTGRVLRVVGGLHQHVRRFEELGHRWRRIRQAALRERACAKQVAELVVHARLAHAVQQAIAGRREESDHAAEENNGRPGSCHSFSLRFRSGRRNGATCRRSGRPMTGRDSARIERRGA